MQVGEWKDRDEIVPQEKESLQFVRRNRKGKRHRLEQCDDFDGTYECMRCGKRSKRENVWERAVASDGWRRTSILN